MAFCCAQSQVLCWYYINKYQLIYKNLVKQAKKMENDRVILSSKNKTKGIWQVINKETGNSPRNNCNIQLRNNTELVTDPQIISEKFNSFFIDTVNDLLSKKSSYKIKQTCRI